MKTLWHKHGKGLTLKQFAQKLLETEEGERRTLAQNWFAHKSGVLEQEAKAERLKNKGQQLAEIRLKVRASRRKSAAPAKPETAKKNSGAKGRSPSATPVKK
jgi:hypothetical protein